MKDSPSRLIPFKPDWKKAEENMARELDYYESTRALGELFRSITFKKPDPVSPVKPTNGVSQLRPLIDTISQALIPLVAKHLGTHINSDAEVREMSTLYNSYLQELRYMRLTHALSDSPDSRLEEEEIVVGTILANCSQHRYRTDRTYRMRLHSATVVRDIQRALYKPDQGPGEGELRYGLRQAWLAWDFGMRYKYIPGGNSFAIIALGVICNVLEGLGELRKPKGSGSGARSSSPEADAEDEDEPEYSERI